jgi:HSP20 family molecular chaperone IbpA
MPEERHTLHIRIRDLRRERSLTQEELADALGISRQSINAMEAGRCLPSLPVALQIASFFSVPLTTVFALNDSELQEAQEIINNSQRTAQLVQWSPLHNMREMLDDMMDTIAAPVPEQGSVPAINIAQTPTEVHVDLRLPGFKKDDLSIEVGSDFLTVSGQTTEDDGKNFVHREFASQSFTRTMSLPSKVETESASAEMKHGVLSIVLQKYREEKPKTKKIEIKAE